MGPKCRSKHGVLRAFGSGETSKKELSRLLSLQQPADIPGNSTGSSVRYDVRRLNDPQLESVKFTTLQLPLEEGDGHYDWMLAHPTRLVEHLARESAALRRLFAESLERFPNTMERPWRVTLLTASTTVSVASFCVAAQL